MAHWFSSALFRNGSARLAARLRMLAHSRRGVKLGSLVQFSRVQKTARLTACVRVLRILCLHAFDGNGGGFSTADAQRSHAAFPAPCGKGMDEGDDQPASGGTDGMALRASAAVDIDLCPVQPQFVHRHHRYASEGFVDLEQVDVVLGPAHLVEQLGDGAGGGEGELGGMDRMGGVAGDPGQRSTR